ERLELGLRAAQADLRPRRRLDERDRHEAAGSLSVGRFDDERWERPRDGIDDHASQLPTHTVATRDSAANRELLGSAHRTPASPLSGLGCWQVESALLGSIGVASAVGHASAATASDDATRREDAPRSPVPARAPPAARP